VSQQSRAAQQQGKQGTKTVAFAMGFAVWIVLGLLGGFVMYFFYRGPETTQLMSIVLSVFGAFIGGMLGMSPYIHHAPLPLRLGGLIGATAGAFGFALIYHFVARKAV
jgi:uncharacterized membrane protein YeaQ/YmgE (transglycosylase-associated protein family)